MLSNNRKTNLEAAARRCPVKKVLLKISQNSQENTCTRVTLFIMLQAWDMQLSLKNRLAQAFFCEFCEIFKNTFFNWTPLVATSVKIISPEAMISTIFLLQNSSVYLQTIFWFIAMASWLRPKLAIINHSRVSFRSFSRNVRRKLYAKTSHKHQYWKVLFNLRLKI